MKMLTTLRAASIATFAGAAISLPVLAQATDVNRGYYNPGQECRKKEGDAKLVGGLLGAVAGGVFGSQVAGNGARTEGSAIGAVLGGLAGAGIGDKSVDCDKRRRQSTNTTYYNGQTYGRSAPVRYSRTVTRRVSQPAYSSPRYDRYRNNGYRNNRGYNNRGYNNNSYAQLEDVRHRLRKLRREDKRLDHQLQHSYDYRLQNRSDWVHKEIKRLERKKRRLNRRLNNRSRVHH
ncbi:MAG: glycine zipper 2TM domain-containing protein [Robiginitomaculum sp.]|nr:glycine zipper 2TM domain-containing protein [Robiginitomaculum sp.]